MCININRQHWQTVSYPENLQNRDYEHMIESLRFQISRTLANIAFLNLLSMD